MTAELSLPEPEEVEQAALIGKELSSFVEIGKGREVMLVFRKEGRDLELPFPPSALQLLLRIMGQIALGNSVTLIPIHAQLTTQEAADLLNVSRPFVVKLLKEGKIPCIKVGAHRRVRFEDLMEYKNDMLAESEQARAELAKLGQEIEQED
ncbi:Putative antitoxin VapB50 [Chlamydiales bacterium SCGC AG-110-M15]|nr:Putative antitoxin VapB50 [Chlamydiales bacterium SCGC AG-110-M15]